MARILLAKARFLQEDTGGMLVPPLGAMYVAAVLREAGHDLRIFDVGEEWTSLARFRREIEAFQPDFLGLSAITIEARVMEAMATAARACRPHMPIIVGGPHATAYPERCARHPAIDFAVVGEGERTIVELIHALTHEEDPRNVAGLVYVDSEGELVETAERASIEDVDGIPFPAWDLIDVGYYANKNPMSGSGRRRYMLMFTSRGCPFKCIYCHEVQGKRFRARSPENVLKEIGLLRDRHGVNDFEIIDDIFNFDRERMIEILDRVRALAPRPALHFPNALRTDILDEKQILALRRAGTTSLSIAVETTSPRLQKLVRKHLRVERVRENIEIAVRHGMLTRGFFMLGFPTETYDEARATVDFALRSPLHKALFFLVTPFAGTTLYEMYRELLSQRGVSSDFNQMDYELGRYNLSEMTDEQLFSLQRDASRRFYMNPGRLARLLVRHPSPVDLFRTGLETARVVFRRDARLKAPPPVPRAPPAVVPAPSVSRLPVLATRPEDHARQSA